MVHSNQLINLSGFILNLHTKSVNSFPTFKNKTVFIFKTNFPFTYKIPVVNLNFQISTYICFSNRFPNIHFQHQINFQIDSQIYFKYYIESQIYFPNIYFKHQIVFKIDFLKFIFKHQIDFQLNFPKIYF